MILLIRDSFIPAFVGLEMTLRSKLEEVKNILRLSFNNYKNITELYSEIPNKPNDAHKGEDSEVRIKICDLNVNEFNVLFENFNS